MAAYKASEKRWKRATDKDLLLHTSLLDPRNLNKDQQAKVHRIGSWKWRPEDEERPVLAFDDFGAAHRGFCVIPNALDPKTQLQFAHACLTEFAEEPHVTNMHLQNQQNQVLKPVFEHHSPDYVNFFLFLPIMSRGLRHSSCFFSTNPRYSIRTFHPIRCE